MRILQLCPRFPYPLTDGGRISMFNVTAALRRRGHELAMIAYAEPDTTPEAIAHVSRLCQLRVVTAGTRTGARNLLRSVLRGEPVYITRHRSRVFSEAVRDAIAEFQPDVVYGDHSAMFPFLLTAARLGIPTVVRLHNLESVIWRRYAENERHVLRRPVAAWQARMLERYEARAAARVDANLAITDVDRLRLERLAPGARVVTVMPGVDLDAWQVVERRVDAHAAVLATTFAWIHNVNGILWFLDEVSPRILDRMPEFELHLIGRNPPASLQRRAGEHVKVLGFIGDLRSHMTQAGVYIVPLHVGGGIRIKILEAMAMGLPVVSTAVGCEGIGARDGTHLLVADTAQAFADAVVRVLSDRAFADAMGRDARAFVERTFSWDAAAESIEQEFTRAIARHSSSTQR